MNLYPFIEAETVQRNLKRGVRAAGSLPCRLLRPASRRPIGPTALLHLL
jgi:hypothetical protein